MPHATPSPKPTSPSTPTFPSARLINANYANPNPVPLRCSIILERGEGGRDTRADSQLIIVIDISSPPFLHGSTFDRLKWPQRERGGRGVLSLAMIFRRRRGGEISLVELIERFRTIPPPPPPFSVFRIRPIISRDHIARERFETLTFVRGKEAGDGL